jgi:hypothetical protein
MLYLYRGEFIHSHLGKLISKNECFDAIARGESVFPNYVIAQIASGICKTKKIEDRNIVIMAALQLVFYGSVADPFALDYATALLFLLTEQDPDIVRNFLNLQDVVSYIAKEAFPGGQKTILEKIYKFPKVLTTEDLQHVYSIYKSRMVCFLALGLDPTDDYIARQIAYWYLQVDIHIIDGGVPSKLFLEFVASMNTLIFDTFTEAGLRLGYSILENGKRKSEYRCTLAEKGSINTFSYTSPCKCPCEGCTIFVYFASSIHEFDSKFPSDKVLSPLLLDEQTYMKKCAYTMI